MIPSKCHCHCHSRGLSLRSEYAVEANELANPSRNRSLVLDPLIHNPATQLAHDKDIIALSSRDAKEHPCELPEFSSGFLCFRTSRPHIKQQVTVASSYYGFIASSLVHRQRDRVQTPCIWERRSGNDYSQQLLTTRSYIRLPNAKASPRAGGRPRVRLAHVVRAVGFALQAVGLKSVRSGKGLE